MPMTVFFCPRACPALMLSPQWWPMSLPRANWRRHTGRGMRRRSQRVWPERSEACMLPRVMPVTMARLMHQM